MMEFRTLGGVALGDPGNGHEARSILAGPKRVAILAYLVVAGRATVVSREKLFAMFWPESSDTRARNALNQFVFVLRRGLGPSIIVSEGSEAIGLNPESLWCDAVVFEALLERGKLEEALDLYSGEFLDGFHLDGCPSFERWLDTHRSQLREQALGAALQLARQREARGNPVGALPWYYRARDLAPFDGAILRRMMKTLALVGDDTGAVREFEAYERRLSAELNMAPSTELVRAVREIQSRPVATIEPEPRQPSVTTQAEERVAQHPRASSPRRPRLVEAAVAVLASLGVAYVSVPEPESTSAPPVLDEARPVGLAAEPRFAGWADATQFPGSLESLYRLSVAADDFVAGRHPEAVAGFREVAIAEPGLSLPRLWAALSLTRLWYHSGHTADSLRAAADSVVASFDADRDDLSDWDGSVLAYVEGLLAIDFPRAHSAIREAVRTASGPVWQLELALMAMWLDRPREVLDVLSRFDVNEVWLEPIRPRYWSLVLTSHHRLGNYLRELELIRGLKADSVLNRRVGRLEIRALIAARRDHEVLAEFDRRMASDQPGGLMGIESELRAHGYEDLADRAVARIVDLLGARPEESRDDDWRILRARYLLKIDRFQEAEVLLSEIKPESPRYLDALSEIGILAASRGERELALRTLGELDAIPQTSLRTQYQARIAAALGDPELAVRLLRQSESPARGALHRELEFPSLQGYPPFQELERPRG